jgi:hypothetical protein
MKKDFDPIKIIKILPLSNRPQQPPRGPNPLSGLVKKTLRAIQEVAVRVATTFRTQIPRVRAASGSLYARVVSRIQLRQDTELPSSESLSRPNFRLPASSAQPETPECTDSARAPHPVSVWILSTRESAMAAWARRHGRWDAMKTKLAASAGEWREKLQQACGTQQQAWRKKTEQMVRPLTSAVRSLRRRHDNLVEQLNSTHAIVRTQQQEITELAFHLASIKTEMAAQNRTIEELTQRVDSLQASMAQTLPTHGTTGQSGPTPQGKRGTTATKRHGPSETGPQSRAEH